MRTSMPERSSLGTVSDAGGLPAQVVGSNKPTAPARERYGTNVSGLQTSAPVSSATDPAKLPVTLMQSELAVPRASGPVTGVFVDRKPKFPSLTAPPKPVSTGVMVSLG